MSGGSESESIVSRGDIERLVPLYDAWANASDPDSPSALESERVFDQEVEAIFTERIEVQFPGISLSRFKAAVRLHCIRYLNRETRNNP